MAKRIRTDKILYLPTEESVNRLPKAKVKKFLYKISLGESRVSAFKEIFPDSEKWDRKTIYSHVNAILINQASQNMLKEYRDKMISLFDQKKIELIHFLEYEIYDNKQRTFIEKLKTMEIYLRLMESFKEKNEQVIQNINITTEKTKENKIKEIFGIKDEDVIEAELKE